MGHKSHKKQAHYHFAPALLTREGKQLFVIVNDVPLWMPFPQHLFESLGRITIKMREHLHRKTEIPLNQIECGGFQNLRELQRQFIE